MVSDMYRFTYIGTSTKHINPIYNIPKIINFIKKFFILSLDFNQTAIIPMVNSSPDNPQMDSSIIFPKYDVVMTEYHEKISATRINGTMSCEIEIPKLLPTSFEISFKYKVS